MNDELLDYDPEDLSEEDEWLMVEGEILKSTCHIELTEWAEHDFWGYRRTVAYNPHTPVPVLFRLASDEDEEVRGFAISNPSYVEAHNQVVADLNVPPELPWEMRQQLLSVELNARYGAN